MQSLAAVAKREWRKQAQDNLKTFRGSYVAAIQDPEVVEGMATVVLAGAVANRVENGYAAYDMHDTLLGDKVPVVRRRRRTRQASETKKGGYYRVIPFRHATPETQGEVGPEMGSAFAGQIGDRNAHELGKAIYAIAKKVKRVWPARTAVGPVPADEYHAETKRTPLRLNLRRHVPH